MLGINRYILRQLAVGMVLVTIGLTAILWLTQSLRFVELTVNKGASVGTFIKLTLLVMPNFLTIILPVALFTVTLFTYNKMISDRELVVLRAAGLSHWALARPAMILAWINVLLVDDHAVVREGYRRLLERCHPQVLWQGGRRGQGGRGGAG